MNIRRGIKSKLPISFLKKKHQLALFFVAFISIFSFISSEVLAIPNLINYQGRLRDNTGTPTTSSTAIQFSIYNDASSGAPDDTPSASGPLLWTETRDGSSGSCPKVSPDAQGYFTINLGSCVSFPSYLDFSTGTYYLAVKIESDAEASPRVILATHPYAFNSDRVDGFHASSTAAANTLLALDNNLNLNILSGGFTGANLTMNSSTATSSISGNLSVIGNTLMATATIANLVLTGASSFGTISAGTWQGDIIATNYGGTGQDTSGWTGFVKINNGVWSTSTVNLTSDIAGILPIANGGTNAGSFASNEFVWFNGTSLTGSGFTSTSFMVSGTDNWVNVAGDTMTGALIINNNLSVTGTSTLATSTISRLMVGTGLPSEIPSDFNFNFASFKEYNHLSNTGDGFELGNILGMDLNPDEDASTTINTLFNVTTNATNDKNFDVLAGILNQVQHYGSGHIEIMYGQLSGVDLETPTGSVGLAVGIQGAVSNGADDVSYNGIISNAIGISGNIENGIGGGTIGYAAAFQSNFRVENGNIGIANGMRIFNPTGSASGTIGNLYGLYIEEQNFATTSNFNIYSDGTASINYFGGKVGIGTTSPLSALDVYGNLSITGADRYLNFGNNTGTVGYGIRDNAGVMQWKNASGGWNNFSTKVDHIINVAKSGGDFDNLEDAIAFANSVDYDTIINIYPGVYDVSSTLVVTSTRIKGIRGMSREAVMIRPTTDLVSSPGPIFEINFSEENDFSLRLLTIDGSQTAGFQNTAGCDAVRVSNTGSVWMDFSELVIIGTETGIDMQVANLLNIFKTDFYSIGNIGVDLDNGASAQVENVYMEDVENRFVHLKSTTGSSSFYMVGSEFGSNSDLGTGLFIEGDASYAEIRYSNMWGLDYNIITNDDSATKVTASYLQKAATLNIDQKDSSAINISSSDGAFSSADISINNPANVYFYALAEEEGVVLFGRHSNINQDVIKIDTGMAILPKLSYQADYYRNNGLIFVNDNPGERTMLGVQATSSEAKLSAISGDRSAIAGLYLYSDTDGFGSTSSMRGWMMSKYGTNSNLLFNFYNNDTGDGKSLIDNKLMTLDGFNSLMYFQGGAIFNSSSGNYDFQVKTPDNDYALFVQGSSDNVGIGTSTPNSQLTVDGDIDITGSYLMNGIPLTTVDPGVTEGQFAYWDGDSWTPTSNIFVSSSGFIGIGTTTPKNALTLIGGLSICSTSPAVTSYTLYNLGGQLYWNGSPVVGGSTSTFVQDADGDTKVETEASPNENRIHFQTAGTERMIIDENGLVAINTTTANGKAFYLYGDVNNEFNLAIHNNNAGPSSTAEFSLYNDLGKLGGLTALSSGWNDGLPGISGSLALYSVSDLLLATIASGGDIIFDVDLTDEQRSMVIAGIGGGNAGYVGIGTSTPYDLLEVWGADLSSSPTSSRNYITIVANGNGEAGHYIRRVNSGSYDNGWSWYMPTSSLDFRLWDDSIGAEGDDILTVQAGTGHIGIGQALYDPLNKLHVDGGIYLGDTATATTTNSVYNIGGDLYWNGNLLASAGGATANWLLTSHNGGNVLTTSTTLPVWFKDIVYASSSVYIDGTLNILGNSILATTTISDLTVNNINVLGTVSTTDILVADSITLGGVTRNTWPTGGGGDGIWATTTANVAYPDLSGNYAAVIGNSATSSDVKFEVLGDTKLGGDLTVTGKSKVNGTSTLTGPVLFGDYAQFSTVGNNNLYFNNNTGNYLRWNNTGGRFEFSNPLQITGFVSSTDLQVNGNATTTGKMYIGSSLSIGIPDPNYHKLEIYEANADVSAEIKTASSSKVSVINVKAGSDTDFLQIGYYGSTHPGVAGILPGSAVWDSVAPGGSYFINESTQDSAALVFMTGGWQASNERLRITSEGKIGIGTSTPQDTLSVEGLSNSNLFGVYTSSSLLKFAVDNIGRVGIGTGTPQAPLHVVTDQTGPAMTILQKTIAGATNLNFVTNNNKYWQLSKRDGTENDKLRFYFNDGSLFYNVFTLGSTGTVGINNDNPDAMLSVVGTSTYPLLNISTSSSAPYLYMNNLGQVSIGTSANPGVPLYVYGNTSPVITRNIGAVGGAQSALQIGVDNTTAPAGTGPSYLFFANDAAGNKEFLGRLNAVWEDSTNGAERGAITLSVRNGSGDTTANTEAVRITSYGFVGLSTSTPPAFLSLYTNTSSLINITNSSTGYALLEGKYLSQNFGMSLETGAFIARNSYFGEEFMRNRANITADNAYTWGDFQQFGVDENAACTWTTVNNAVNGIGRQQASNGANSCLAYHASVAGTAHTIFNVANLPIFTFKTSPSIVASNRRFWIGASDLAQAQSTDPTNGIYFTNNTTNGVWQGVSRRAGASTVVDCAGQTINTAVFGVAKIEVVSSNGDGTGEVNFYIDNDATNGVDWFYCGQATTNIPTVGLTSMIMNNTVAGGGAQYIDIDYYRVWQDDSAETVIEEIVEEIPEYIEKNIFGMAQIKAGDSLVQVDFDGEYAVPPMMGVTPLGFDGRWKLQNVTTRGFEISLVEQAIDNVLFNWQAYVVEDDTKIHSSDGSIQLVKDFYLDFNPLINIPQSGSSGESTPAMPSGTSTPPVEETPPVETPTEPVVETPPVEEPAPAPEEPPVEDPVDPVETPVDVPVE